MSKINWLERAERAELTINNVINGEVIPVTVPPDSEAGVVKKYSPRDGRFLYSFSEGSSADVDQAVTAAREAFNDGRWRGLAVSERAAVLNRLADLVEENSETLALYDSLDVGMSISYALNNNVGNTKARLRSAAKLAPELQAPSGADLGCFAYQRHKPVGVVAGVAGWNNPLSMAAGKVGPALVMGNSLVLKPSEFTALSTQYLATLALEAGVPPGVFNVVNGAGHTVGEALSNHPDIDLIAFVGSSATGRRVMAAAAQSNMKRVQMECGGKSPFIVFDDCSEDLNFLADQIVGLAFPNQGALCVAGTRLLLQRGVREKLLPLVIEKASAIKAGDPLSPETRFGALMNEAHMEKVLGYIERGVQQGAKLILGGKRVYPQGDKTLHTGFYIEPTIFDKVSPDAIIAQEEIFGPVLSVFTFEDEAEGIALANNSSFGLAAYAATTNLGRAQRLGEHLDVGSLLIFGTSEPTGDVNSISSDKHKQSGMGFNGGLQGLAAYTVTTSVGVLA